MPLLQGQRLVAKLARTRARVIELIAPAGFGKTTVASALGESIGRYDFVTATGEHLIRALEAHPPGSFVAIVDDLDSVPHEQTAALAAAIEWAPPESRIVLCSRRETSLHHNISLPPHERLVLRASDLALDESDVRAVFEPLNIDRAQLREIIDLCEGWPVAVLAARQAIVDGGSLTYASLQQLFSYLDEHIVKTLDTWQREALMLCSGLPHLDREQIAAALSPPYAAEALLGLQLAHVDSLGGISVRPLLQTLVRHRYALGMIRVLNAAALAFAQNGIALYASCAYLNAGDLPKAAAALAPVAERPKELLAFPYQSLYENDRDDHRNASLKSYPELWVALFLHRRYKEPADAVLQDALEMLDSGNESMLPALYNAVLAIAATVTIDAGRPQLGRELLTRAKQTESDEADDALLLQCAQAALDVHTGNQQRATETWSRIRKSFWGYHAWFAQMMLIEVKLMRVKSERSAAAAAAARMLSVAQKSGSPSLVGQVLVSAAFTAWLFGDDDRLEQLLAQLQHMLEKTVAPPLRAIADAFSGLYRGNLEDYPFYNGWVKLISAASYDTDTARKLVRDAIWLGDRNQDASLRVMARLALSRLDPDRRALLNLEASSIHAEIVGVTVEESEELLRAQTVFYSRYDRSIPAAGEKEPVRIEVASGRIHRGGKDVKLPLKSTELLFALAVETRPIARDLLLARLWPDRSVESALSALKMCVHRTRQQLGDPDAVVVHRGLYRLGDRVSSDMREVLSALPTADQRLRSTPFERRRILESLLCGRPSAFAKWEWFAPIEQQLLAITTELGLSLAKEALAEGDVERALSYAASLTQIDPCDEAATELLIRAHLQRGERNLALAKYRRLARSLKNELDIEPSNAVRALLD